MSTTLIEEPQFEIVPAELGLELSAKNSLELAFSGFFATATEWKAKASTITDAKEARTARLEMKNLRVAVEKKHKELKADSLLFGRAVDGAKNIFLALATPIERQLDDIEKAEERKESARIEALREERAETLDSMGHVSHGINLGTMSDADWKEYLQQAKDVYEFRKEQEKRRIAAAEEEAKRQEEEREASRLESIRLREEAAAAAAALEAERKERAAAEAAAKAEYERIEREAAEYARQEREKDRIAREKIEAAAAEERRKAIEAAAKETAKREKAEAEAKALRDAEAKRVANEKAAADQLKKSMEAAAKKAAAAPDKQRILDFAMALRTLPLPEMKSEAGKDALDRIVADLSETVQRIRDQASTL